METDKLDRELRKWRRLAIVFACTTLVVLIAGLLATHRALAREEIQRTLALRQELEAREQRGRAEKVELEIKQRAEELQKIAEFQEQMLRQGK